MDNNDYQIILDPVPEGKQSAAALFLSGCFSLPPVSTRRIAAAGPIVILSGLDGIRAEAVMAEIVPALPEGISLRTAREGEEQDISRLDWPNPPKIFGRPLDDFALKVTVDEAPCPACGKMLRIKQSSDGELSVKLVRDAGKTVMIPNPTSIESDKDPLFSGFKPLATDSSTFASIRSLKAGDTGFWGDSRAGLYSNQYEEPPRSATAKESSMPGKSSGGLVAYMKPGVFAVIVGRTKDPLVVKKVAEILGISEDEAREKCLGFATCIARDISLDEAQNLTARFKILGARVRIAKPL